AGLADEVGAAIVGVEAFFLEARLVLRVDAAEVAEDVRADLAVRILAEQPRLQLHALVAEAVGGEAGRLLVGEPAADRQALGVTRLGEQLAEARAIARLDVDQLGELVDRSLQA